MINNKGFTLIEVMVVIIILTILAAVIAPPAMAYIDKSRQEVCDLNRAKLEKMYNVDLLINNDADLNEDHLKIRFTQYLEEHSINCPSGGFLKYSNGLVECSIHTIVEIDDNENDDSEDDNEVPFF